MTARVKAGCLAAIEFAVANAEHPNVLEVTLRLGSLEGVWATIYARRQKLEDDCAAKIMPVWRYLVAHVTMVNAIRTFRSRVGLGESTEDDDHRAEAIALMLITLRNMAGYPQWGDLRDILQDALVDAHAEGAVAAMALAADKLGLAGFDYERAFTDARQELIRSGKLDGFADPWLSQMINSTATDVGRALAKLAKGAATSTIMLSTVMGLLDSNTAPGVTLMIDLAISQTIAMGFAALLAAAGVKYLSFVTAGDGKVCQICADAEKDSPYALGDAPQPGLHPRCRCSLDTSDSLPMWLLRAYLPAG